MNSLGYIANSIKTPTHENNNEKSEINTDYKILNGENRTASKSFLSKLKNLSYTLGSPFRALLRRKIENSIGVENSPIAMMHIKSEQRPASFYKLHYVVVDKKEGYGPRPFMEKIFG